MDIVDLEMQDLNACMELDQLAMGGFWSRTQWEGELTNPKGLRVGLKQSSHLYAFASGLLLVDELQLNVLAVHPSHRRVGNAKRLLLCIFQRAKIAGAKRVILEVSSSNLEAQYFYQNFGFKTNSIRRSYYRNGSDAFIQSTSLLGQ